MVSAATEPLTERPAVEFSEGITSCCLSTDASGWLTGDAFHLHAENGDAPRVNGVDTVHSPDSPADSFALVARCEPLPLSPGPRCESSRK